MTSQAIVRTHVVRIDLPSLHRPIVVPSIHQQAPPKRRRVLHARTHRISASLKPSLDARGWLVDDLPPQPGSPPCNAIMVLGGGLLPDGGLPEWVLRRLEGALYLQRQQSEACPILLLGAGTPHKPPVLQSNGYVLHESTAYASYLISRGVPAAYLLKETSSYDTVGNAYFSLTMHALPAGWRKVAVVTSAFHMPRTKATFDTAYRIAAAEKLGDPDAFELLYYPVSDEGIFHPEVLAARIQKETLATATWHANIAKLPEPSLAALHSWMFATHLCYSVSRQDEFGTKKDIDAELAKTY